VHRHKYYCYLGLTDIQIRQFTKNQKRILCNHTEEVPDQHNQDYEYATKGQAIPPTPISRDESKHYFDYPKMPTALVDNTSSCFQNRSRGLCQTRSTRLGAYRRSTDRPPQCLSSSGYLSWHLSRCSHIGGCVGIPETCKMRSRRQVWCVLWLRQE
jgi:hypothetical protein